MYEKRREKMYDWMARENISLVMIEDTEGRRDPGVRWLSGHPGDALFFLTVDRKDVLVPWDINLAMLYSSGKCDAMIPFSEFERRPIQALEGVLDFLQVPPGTRIEIPPVMPYPLFLNYVEAISDYDILCREGGAASEIERLRALKDEAEIKLYRNLSAKTCDLTNLLEENIRQGRLKTETDVALFIESEARKRGCEGTGFDTIVAGPERSFGIHAFPAYTAGAFGSPGLSILDYGIKYDGYTSDVTLTFARGPLEKPQERMINLVEKAYNLALSMAVTGASCRDIGIEVDAFFSKSKKSMPHSLGHGIGLEAHEAPSLRGRSDNEWVLEPGMIITLEPGLYDQAFGGCRLENDILITETGPEVLTNSRIIRL